MVDKESSTNSGYRLAHPTQPLTGQKRKLIDCPAFSSLPQMGLSGGVGRRLKSSLWAADGRAEHIVSGGSRFRGRLLQVPFIVEI